LHRKIIARIVANEIDRQLAAHDYFLEKCLTVRRRDLGLANGDGNGLRPIWPKCRYGESWLVLASSGLFRLIA
jgi:hypothetical protein